MNRRLIIKAVIINSGVVIASIILGSVIIGVFASQFFNKNAEEYLFVIGFFAGLPVSFFAFTKAESGKIAHAVIVYLLTQISVALLIFTIILLFFLAIKIYCAGNRCNLFPLS